MLREAGRCYPGATSVLPLTTDLTTSNPEFQGNRFYLGLIGATWLGTLTTGNPEFQG